MIGVKPLLLAHGHFHVAGETAVRLPGSKHETTIWSLATPTVVDHNMTLVESFPDDICGARANTTTFTRKMEQFQLTEQADGSFMYRDVAVVYVRE